MVHPVASAGSSIMGSSWVIRPAGIYLCARSDIVARTSLSAAMRTELLLGRSLADKLMTTNAVQNIRSVSTTLLWVCLQAL